jgi:superfamily I DNA and/or RNA helicase
MKNPNLPFTLDKARMKAAEELARSAQDRMQALTLEQHQAKIDLYPGMEHKFISNDGSEEVTIEYKKNKYEDQSEIIVHVGMEHQDMSIDRLLNYLEKEFEISIRKYDERIIVIYSKEKHEYHKITPTLES